MMISAKSEIMFSVSPAAHIAAIAGDHRHRNARRHPEARCARSGTGTAAPRPAPGPISPLSIRRAQPVADLLGPGADQIDRHARGAGRAASRPPPRPPSPACGSRRRLGRGRPGWSSPGCRRQRPRRTESAPSALTVATSPTVSACHRVGPQHDGADFGRTAAPRPGAQARRTVAHLARRAWRAAAPMASAISAMVTSWRISATDGTSTTVSRGGQPLMWSG